jgi:hypothetical protein
MTTLSPKDARQIAKEGLYLPKKEALNGVWKRPEPKGTPIKGGK